MFIKLGESIEINRIEDINSCIPAVSAEVLDNFKKFASNLKRIAPRAEDFLYFSAVIMHAAEASALNDDGTPRLDIQGQPVKVSWDKSDNTWRWVSSDRNIKPYRNSNGDIFPEEELVKAFKKWVGKPLCIDHKSSSVDHVRGFIVDTYYDRSLKRVIALCALDKQNYPDLARKVATGYSHAVSMGTAVGRAICSDCARVARTESDFCDHMRKKSGYGEINVDLNPIELSIVVNGADPKAHIKHIVAAAQTLNNYVDFKAESLKKMADQIFEGNLSALDPQGDEGGDVHIRLKSSDLEGFKNDLAGAVKKLEDLMAPVEKDTNDLVSNQSSGSSAMAEGTTVSTDFGLAPSPSDRYASTNYDAESLLELRAVASEIQVKLSQMKMNLDKLENINKSNKQEENMSGSKDNINKKAYYQGTEEPTPGQPKYTADPTNAKLRTDGDKHMEGQMDTGPVDGMHPGPDSAGMSELERKKMLARAAAEERALRRAAMVDLAKQALNKSAWDSSLESSCVEEVRAVDPLKAAGLEAKFRGGNRDEVKSFIKDNGLDRLPNCARLMSTASLQSKAYFQGGGGVNEPTPGKTKYPADKMNEDLREDGDKQMFGQKPFPGVGSVDGLHPSPSSVDTTDELKRKEMLRRANTLRATFTKSASNLGNSSWNVFLGDKLILTASVNDLTGGNGDLFFDKVATKEFGSKLIEKIKSEGADKVVAMVKKAQDAAAPMPAAAPAAPAPEMAPPADVEPPAEDMGKSGDPTETVKDLSKQISNLSSDLAEAANLLGQEQSEMGAEPAPEMGASASFGLSTLNTLRKELNEALTGAMKEVIAELQDHKEELDMLANMYEKGTVTASNNEVVESIKEDAINETKSALADGFKLMTAFVKYARGTKAIVKRAEIEAELQALAQEESTEKTMSADDNDLMGLVEDTNADLDDLEGLLDTEEPHHDDELGEEVTLSELGDLDALEVDDNDLKAGDLKPETTLSPEALNAKASTKEGRAVLRAKLAAEALKTSPHLHEAHPKGGVTTDLDVKPSGDLAKVEDLEEVHDKMMDLANAPPKVRKEAEAIHKLVSEGKLAAADLDALVAEGLDKDAVAYYKKYFAQVDGGSEFASELVKEHAKAQAEAEMQSYKIKLARAYELAYDMVDRGLCHNDRGSVSSQVDEIMKFNDESFDSLKRVVARHAPIMRKEAGRMPQVGVIGSGDVNSTNVEGENLLDQLNAAFSKTTKKLF